MKNPGPFLYFTLDTKKIKHRGIEQPTTSDSTSQLPSRITELYLRESRYLRIWLQVTAREGQQKQLINSLMVTRTGCRECGSNCFLSSSNAPQWNKVRTPFWKQKKIFPNFHSDSLVGLHNRVENNAEREDISYYNKHASLWEKTNEAQHITVLCLLDHEVPHKVWVTI